MNGITNSFQNIIVRDSPTGPTGESTESLNLKLRLAAANGQTELLEGLIVDGGDVNARDQNGDTPLHLALRNNHINCAKKLIEVNANPHIPGEFGRVPQHWAADKGYIEILDMLIEADPCGMDVLDGQENTALQWAMFNSHITCVIKLLEAGARRNIKCLLHSAAMNNELELLEKLIKIDPTRINAQDQRNHTPLHWAIRNRHTTCATKLLEVKPKLHLRDDLKRTPLHWAANRGLIEILVMLIEADPSVIDFKDLHGNTPLHLAIENNHIECATKLIEAGADILCANGAGNIFLHLHRCTDKSFSDILIFLFRMYCSFPEALIHRELGNTKVKNQIRDFHRVVHVQNKKGDTLLHVAALNSFIESSKLLLQAGASLDVKNKAGETPRQILKAKGILDQVVGTPSSNQL